MCNNLKILSFRWKNSIVRRLQADIQFRGGIPRKEKTLKYFRKTKAWLAMLLAAIMTSATAAAALTIQNTYPFSVTSNPVGVEFLGIEPFDPGLGSLESVAVSISGVMAVQAFAPPNTSPPPSPVPIPYPLVVQGEQTFSGLAGKFFTFETPAQFLAAGTTTGVGEPIFFQFTFFYSFTFNDITDDIGFVLPVVDGVTTPPIISGQRSDFLADLIPINEISLVQQFFEVPGSGPALQGLQAATNGALTIQYNYSPVTIPGPVWLMGSGLLGLAGWKKVRKRSRRMKRV